MGATENIVLGILSGIVTSFLLYLGTKLFENTLVPWYLAARYKGIDISGNWKYIMTFSSGNVSTFLVEVEQKAEKVKCYVSETKTLVGNSKTEMRIYEYDGSIQDRFVTLAGRDKNKANLGVYSFLLEVKGSGQEMVGYGARHCITGDEIRSDIVKWERV
jgi:hypothetical protein